LPEILVASRDAYVFIVGAQILLSLLVVAGIRAREALLSSALAGAYVLACDRLQFHNNRWALDIDALLLSLAPCDRAWAIGRMRWAPRIGPLWAVRLVQAQLSLIYLTSGGSKLMDPDWRSGRVLFERFVLFGANAVDQGVPQGIVRALTRPEVGSLLAKMAIATELVLAIALWSPSVRALAMWWGLWFHLSIEASSRVEGFSWLTLAVYALFSTPDASARRLEFDPARPLARALARAVQQADWLARFEVRPLSRECAAAGPPLVAVDRDGTAAVGLRAVAVIARGTPLLFPLWLPLAAAASLTKPRETRRTPPS
jgi:hypothetical protein